MTKPDDGSQERVCILVVDDEPAARQTLQAILEDLYAVITVADASEAEEILRTQRVQILVTDYEMPGRSGMDLISLVLEKFPHVVPLLLTGHTTQREVRRAVKDRNVFAVLSKPIDPEQLLRSLRLAVTTVVLRELQSKMATQKGPA